MKNCTAVYRHFGGLLLMCVALVLGGPAFTVAAPSLPFVSPMFGDNMVLQRNKPNTFWGWAAPGEKVRVEIGDKEGADTAGPDGRWEIKVQPPTGAGPITVRIVGRETVQFQNVLVGDVWVCGGQSNMQFPLQSARNGEAELQQADHPQIRFFIVKSQPAYSREAIVQGSWKICSPKTVTEEGGLSAVAYYFARRLQTELNVPIGLIQDCLGGTPAEAWTSPQTLRQLKDFDAALDEVQRLHAKGGPQYGNYIMHWYDEFDIGQRDKGWSAAEFDDSDWKTVTIPGGFGELGVPDTPSLCYFRKTITLPEPLPPGPALIHLGVVEKMDTTYVNGHWVGASAWVENPRAYAISPGILKPGKNIVTVRVLKLKPDGGFQSKPDQLSLVLGDKSVIPLAGEWKGKLSVDARAPHPLPLGFENWPVMPGVLYDGMLAPVAPLALTGAIWYQGEANASHAFQYRTLMPMMIADWRKLFGQGDFPFYIVSLPKFGQHRDTPGDDAWAELREAQALTARESPNSGLAVTIDTGDANDIHPKDKKEVGERLALCALAGQYRQRVSAAGPTFESMDTLPGSIRLHFTNTGGGLMMKGNKLGEFSIAGEDRHWFWADAKIDGNIVIVSSPKVSNPKAVRYAWQSNPTTTLFNAAGLPAVPFRTDDWPGITAKH